MSSIRSYRSASDTDSSRQRLPSRPWCIRIATGLLSLSPRPKIRLISRPDPSIDGGFMAINPDKLNEFLGKAIVDFGATFNAALIRIGDRLGLYKAPGAGGPPTPAELAKKTGTAERYLC